MRSTTIQRIKSRLEDYAHYKDDMDSSTVAVEIYEMVERDVRESLEADLSIAEIIKVYWLESNSGSER